MINVFGSCSLYFVLWLWIQSFEICVNSTPPSWWSTCSRSLKWTKQTKIGSFGDLFSLMISHNQRIWLTDSHTLWLVGLRYVTKWVFTICPAAAGAASSSLYLIFKYEAVKEEIGGPPKAEAGRPLWIITTYLLSHKWLLFPDLIPKKIQICAS